MNIAHCADSVQANHSKHGTDVSTTQYEWFQTRLCCGRTKLHPVLFMCPSINRGKFLGLSSQGMDRPARVQSLLCPLCCSACLYEGVRSAKQYICNLCNQSLVSVTTHASNTTFSQAQPVLCKGFGKHTYTRAVMPMRRGYCPTMLPPFPAGPLPWPDLDLDKNPRAGAANSHNAHNRTQEQCTADICGVCVPHANTRR